MFPMDQILTTEDKRKDLPDLPQRTTWKGDGFSWAGYWVECAIIKTEVGRTGQPRECKTFLVSRASTAGELIDWNIEKLRAGFFLQAVLRSSPRKRFVCFYFPLLPFKCHPYRGESLKTERTGREKLPTFLFGRQSLPNSGFTWQRGRRSFLFNED